MATSTNKSGDLDLRPFVDKLGLVKYLEPVAPIEIIQTIGAEKMAEALSVEQVLARLSNDLSPEKQKQLYEMFGLKDPT